MTLPAEVAALPVRQAQLPAIYERAKQTLAECARVDECKGWADKALALASYARQAQDQTLEKTAMRIRSRAIRRAGELLREIDGRGKVTPKLADKSLRGQTFSRKGAGKAAGLSRLQIAQATNISRIEEADFEAAVESENPPGIQRLARMGSRPGFKRATQALGALHEFADFCQKHDPAATAAGVFPDEIEQAEEWIATVRKWLSDFQGNLGDG